jgi:excisionase family DNA binding protein
MAGLRRKFYTTRQIAQMAGVHISTAIRWIDDGEMPAFRTPGGRRRVSEEDLQAFLARYRVPDTESMAGPNQQKGRARKPRPTILIVDEDQDNLWTLVARLKKIRGASVVGTGSLIEGLMLIGELKPRIVAVELSVGEINALKVIEEISVRKKGVRVMGLTSREYFENSQNTRKLGKVLIVSKADRGQHIEGAVRSVLRIWN